jgi:predicted amidophosphoribosyltransferase
MIEAILGLVVIAVMLLLPFAPAIRRAVALCRKRKTSPGHCPKCGYDLAGIAGGVCPECGRPPIS